MFKRGTSKRILAGTLAALMMLTSIYTDGLLVHAEDGNSSPEPTTIEEPTTVEESTTEAESSEEETEGAGLFRSLGFPLLGSGPGEDEEEVDTKLYINGNDASAGVVVQYGNPMTVTLKKGDSDVTSDGHIYYIPISNIAYEGADILVEGYAQEYSSPITPDAGSYAFFFYTSDNSDHMGGGVAGSQGSVDFWATVSAVRTVACDADSFAWNGTRATWTAPTKDVNNRDLNSPNFTYEVKLYKGDSHTLVKTYAPTSNLYIDCATDIESAGYGSFYYTVTAIPGSNNYLTADTSSYSAAYEYRDEYNPTVESFEVVEEDGVKSLKATATDRGTSVEYYAFAPSTVAVDDLDWIAVTDAQRTGDPNAATEQARNMVTLTASPTASGRYYIYVKDESGNVSHAETDDSDNPVYISKLTLNRCYTADADVSHHKTVLLYGDDSFDLSELTLSRRGYNFEGWYAEEDYSGSVLEGSVTAGSTSGFSLGTDYDLYAKWEQQEVRFVTDLSSSITKTYGETNGATLTVELGDVLYDSIAWTWYKKAPGEEEYTAVDASLVTVSGDKRSSIHVKNVADSGEYYARATVMVDGEDDEIADSTHCNVTINKRNLRLSASASIDYMNPIPDFAFVEDRTAESATEGLAYNDSLASVLENSNASGKVDCDYHRGSDVGTYPISAKAGTSFTTDNYNVIITSLGNLTVRRLDVTDLDTVVVSLDNGEDYNLDEAGAAIEPALTVKRFLDGDGTEGHSLTETADYTVAYSNNVNVSTAESPAVVTVTFNGNYTGTKTVNFNINRITYSPVVSLEGWKYGETPNSPTISTLRESATPTYYYKLNDGSESPTGGTTTRPTNAGDYYVWAHISATSNYEAFDTAVTHFTIEKRTIVITAANGSWEYDGNAHTNATYTITGDGFTSEDGFRYVSVVGTITNIGTLSNVLDCPLTSTTVEGNYDITRNNGTLTITAQRLVNPSSFTWSTVNPGTVSWIAITRDNVSLRYKVKLYRVDNGEYTLVSQEVTTDTSHNFLNDIHGDSAEHQYGYTATIQVEPIYAAGAIENYLPSAESDHISTKYTAKITPQKGNGVTAVRFGNEETGSEEPVVLLQGESVTVYDIASDGYVTDASSIIWTIAETSYASLVSIASPREGSTSLYVVNTSAVTEPLNLTLVANNHDDWPVVNSFSARVADDNSAAYVDFTISDAIGLAKYAVSRNNPASMGNASPETYINNWTDISGTNWSTSTHGSVEVTEGTYYLYVLDSAGNLTVSNAGTNADPSQVSIYKITFDGGTGYTGGSMDPIYKLKDVAVTLPPVAFTRTGYALKNWKGDSTGFFTDEGRYTANVNDTLRVQWTNETYTYTVEYYYMNADGSYNATADKTNSFSCTYGREIVNTAAAIQSSQTGFSIDSAPYEGYESSITVTANGARLKVYYKRNVHTISYSYTNTSGATVAYHTDEYRYGQVVEEWDKPSATGYTFIGWDWGSAGEKPATMTDEDLVVTGSFRANASNYYVVYYFQNLDTSSLDYDATNHYLAPTFSYTESAVETVRSTHGTNLAISVSDAQEFDGYEIQAVKTNLGSVAGTTSNWDEFNDLITNTAYDSANARVTAHVDDPEEGYANGPLYVCYYYTRRSYNLDLKVYKDERETGVNLYNNRWTFPYGYPFASTEGGTTYTAAYFETYNQEHWTDTWPQNSDSLSDYVLANFKDWSTGDQPVTMPAGDVTLTREYATATKTKYSIELYLEGVQKNNSTGMYEAGVYTTPKTVYIRYGNLNSHVSIVDVMPAESERVAGTTYITLSELIDNSAISFINNYEHNPSNDERASEEVLSGTVTSEIVGGVEQNLVLKVHLVRKEYSSYVRYRYQGLDGTSTIFAYTVHRGKWGTTYPVDGLYYFDGETVAPEGGTILNSSIIRNFRANCLVSESSSRLRDDTNSDRSYNPSLKCTEASHLARLSYSASNSSTWDYGLGFIGRYSSGNDVTTYNGSSVNYVEVCYTETSKDRHYVLTPKYETATENEYALTTVATDEEKGITVSINGVTDTNTYSVRLANKADVFRVTGLTDGTGDDTYPAANVLSSEYTYELDGEGHEILRDGFREATVTTPNPDYDPNNPNNLPPYFTGTYYIKGDKIYVIDTRNQFFYGNRISLNMHNDGALQNAAKLGYAQFRALMPRNGTEVKNGQSSIFLVGDANPIENDTQPRDGNNNPSAIISYYHNLHTSYNIVYHYESATATRSYPYRTTVLKADLGVSDFVAREGYEIVWYTDTEHTTEAGDITVTRNIDLFGLELKRPIENKDYVYYKPVNGNYITNLNSYDWTDISSESAVSSGYQKLVDEYETSYVNENGATVNRAGTRSRYYINGNLVAAVYPHFTISYTEFYMTASNYARTGFMYDETNTSNKSKAYCSANPVNMYAYFTREDYILTESANRSNTDNDVISSKAYGASVSLSDPFKRGYNFSGWRLQKTVEDELVDISQAEKDAISYTDGEGVTTFTMPAYDLKATAEYDPTSFDYQIMYYFQNDSKVYNTDLLTSVKNLAGSDLTVSFNGSDETVKAYYDSSSQLLAVSRVENGVTYYYTGMTIPAGESRYAVNRSHLFGAVRPLINTLVSEQRVATATYALSDLGDMFDYAFTQYTYDGATTTYSNLTSDEFTAYADMSLSYYYARSTSSNIRAVAFATTGDETGLTITGDGMHYYGETATLYATVANGYTFEGWYKAEDVLVDYPDDGTVPSSLADYELVDAAIRATKTKLNATDSTDLSFEVTGSADFVAVTIPGAVVLPDSIVISSARDLTASPYVFGYADGDNNKLNTTITWTGDSGSNYIKSYEWYVRYYDTTTDPAAIPESYEITDEDTPLSNNASSYKISTGKAAGSYVYCIEVTIARRDNGLESKAYAYYRVDVAKNDTYVTTRPYTGNYDGLQHTFAITIDGNEGNLYDTEKFAPYYSESALTAQNIDAAIASGTATTGRKYYTNVKVDSNEAPEAYRVYYYIKAIDPNYADVSGSETVLINPIYLSVSAGGASFSKIYDATPIVRGSFDDRDSDFYRLSQGKGSLYRISGILASEQDLPLYLDFQASFDSMHARDATVVTLSNLWIEQVDVNNATRNYNYRFNGAVTLQISGQIRPYSLAVEWLPSSSSNPGATYVDTDFAYNYDGTAKAPYVRITDQNPPDPAGSFEVNVINSQINAGRYTAAAEVRESQGATYYPSDYTFSLTERTYTIKPRYIKVVPKDITRVYNGSNQTMLQSNDDFTFYTKESENDAWTPYTSLPTGETYSVSAASSYRNVGVYSGIAATGLMIWNGEGRRILDNYVYEYGTGTLTITPAPIIVESGISAADKDYDGTTAATLDVTSPVFKVQTTEGSTENMLPLYAGDSLTLDGSKITGTFESAPSGQNKNVSISYDNSSAATNGSGGILTGASAGNYKLMTADSQSSTTASISGATILSLSVGNTSKIYGDTTSYSDYSYNLTGFVTGDSASSVPFSGSLTYMIYSRSGDTYTAVRNDATADDMRTLPAGTYYIAPAVGTGNVVNGLTTDNYTIKWDGNYGVLTVSKRKLTVKAADNAEIVKGYDGTTAATVAASDYTFTAVEGITSSGVVNGDAIGLKSFTKAYNNANATVGGNENTAHKVNITNAVLSDEAAVNYELNNTAFDIDGRITALALTITAANKTVVYGGAVPAFTYTVEGALASEEETITAAAVAAMTATTTYSPIAGDANRVVGTYPITIDTENSYSNSNYNITFVNGTITVTKKTVHYEADNKNMIYGKESLPEFTGSFKASDWAYGENETAIGIVYTPSFVCYETGTTAVSATTPAGTYAIQPQNLNSILADNYTFAPTNGTLSVVKYYIAVDGVYVLGKIYDGTTTVSASHLKTDKVRFIYYENGERHVVTVDDADAEKKTKAEEFLSYINVSAEYETADAGNPKHVNVYISLKSGSYLDKRYILLTEATKDEALRIDPGINVDELTQTGTTSKIVNLDGSFEYRGIDPRPLTLYPTAQTIKYGQSLTVSTNETAGANESVIKDVRPAVDAQTEEEQNIGFVAGQSLATIDFHLNARVNGVAGNTYSTVTDVGTYTIDIGSASTPHTGVHGNYDVSYATGTLTIVQNTFPAPASVSWSDASATAGTLNWTAVSSIGNVAVDHYEIQLYKGSNLVGTYNSATTSIDLSSYIRGAGGGSYTAKVRAIASLTNNVVNGSDYANVAMNGLQKTSVATYASNVTVVYSSNAVTTAASNNTAVKTVNGAASYVMIKGQTGVPVAYNWSCLRDGEVYNTGYSVSDIESSNINVTLGTAVDNSASGSYSTTISASELNSGADTAITLTLAARPADLTVTVARDFAGNEISYGYPANMYSFDATPSHSDSTDYSYTYNWYYQVGSTAGTRVNPSPAQTTATFVLPTGIRVNATPYRAYCEIVATRKDNGQSITVKNYDSFKVVKRQPTPENSVVYSSPNNWTYGDARANITATPLIEDMGVITIEYNTVSNQNDSGWTTVIPKNVGSYYARANVAASADVDAVICNPVAFSINQNTLANPTNLGLGVTTSAAYGNATWTAVPGPRENAGAAGDSDSAITVTYKVKLYSVENDVRTLVKEYPVTSATELDMSTELNNQGKYVYSVQALSDNTANCANSAETFYTSTIDVSGILRSNLSDGSFAKTYDGTPITLSVEFSEPESYQWYCNGAAISGATGPTYDVTYVRQNGIYSCQLGKGGSTYESTFRQVTISPKEVELTTTSGTWTYDATAHTKNVTAGENKDYSLTPVSSDAVTAITMPSSITNVGSVSNTVSGLVITHSGGEVVYRQADAALQNNTNNYLITYTYGTLTVAKSQVTITAGSTWKVYDGTPLSYNALSTVSHTALVQGHSLTAITVTGSRTTAGTCGNIPTDPVIEDGSGNDVTSNYDITLVVGTLTVTQRPITITGGSSSKEYDGTPLTFTGNHTAPGAYSITSGDLATGDEVDALTLTGSQTIVGSTANVPSGLVIKNSDEEDVTASYDISYLNGTLSVTKTNQLISFTSGSFEYDGSGHNISASVTASADVTNGTPCGQITYYKVEADNSETLLGTSYSFTNAGTYTLRAKAAATNDYNAVTSSDITLTITRRPISITAGSDSKEYDGTPLTKNSYSALYAGSAPGTNAALGSGDRFTTVTVTGTERDVNGSETNNNNITAVVIKNAADENVNDNYDITLVAGTLTVTPRPVAIEWSHDNLGIWSDATYATIYNNQDRTVTATNISNKVTIEGVEDVVYVATYASSGTDLNVARGAGSYTAVAASLAGSRSSNYTLTGGTAVSKNWSISKAVRTITVSPVTAVYDGQAHLVTASQNGSEDLGTIGVTYSPLPGSPALVSGNPVHAGTYNATVSIPATDNYQAAETTVTVSISKKPLTITSDSAEKVYDGTPLTKELLLQNGITKSGSTYTINDTNDSLSLTFTGSLTDVVRSGSAVTTVNNTYENVQITFTDGTTDVTSMDYVLTYAYGSLRVTPKALTIMADNGSFIYDGTAHSMHSYTASGLVSGDTVTSLSYTGSVTNVSDTGTGNNVPSAAQIKRGSTVITDSYDISYVSGNLAVTARPVSLTADNKQSYYGENQVALTHTTVGTSVTGAGDMTAARIASELGVSLAIEVIANKTPNGRIERTTPVGTYGIVLSYSPNANYTVTKTDGTYTVHPATITSSATGYSGQYDGRAHGISVTTTPTAGVTVYYSMSSITTDAELATAISGGTATTTLPVFTVPGSNTVYYYAVRDNFDSSHGSADVVISRRDITLTAGSASKTYDGNILEKKTYSITSGSLGNGDRITSVSYSPGISNATTQANAITAVVIENAAGTDVTNCYNITKVDGSLTINRAATVITADNITLQYDGNNHMISASNNSGAAITYTSGGVAFTGAIIPGTYNVLISSAANGNYEAASKNVILTISPRNVVVRSATANKYYDGSPLTAPDITVDDGGLLGDDTIDITGITAVGSIIQVGRAANTIQGTATITLGSTGSASLDYYNIVYAAGVLSVLSQPSSDSGDSSQEDNNDDDVVVTPPIPPTVPPATETASPVLPGGISPENRPGQGPEGSEEGSGGTEDTKPTVTPNVKAEVDGEATDGLPGSDVVEGRKGQIVDVVGTNADSGKKPGLFARDEGGIDTEVVDADTGRMINELLNEEEKEGYESGADIIFRVSVKEESVVKRTLLKKSEEAVPDGMKILGYLDTELFVKVGDEKERLIEDRYETVSVSFDIPEEMWNESYGSSYRIMRVYEDEDGNIISEIVNAVFNGRKVTMDADNFSTYVVIGDGGIPLGRFHLGDEGTCNIHWLMLLVFILYTLILLFPMRNAGFLWRLLLMAVNMAAAVILFMMGDCKLDIYFLIGDGLLSGVDHLIRKKLTEDNE